MNNQIKFKKNESFYIREGWFEKAINSIAENDELNVFSGDNGVKILGIGSNMVKSLKYWLEAANIIENTKKCKLTNFGELIFKYDKYLENSFTWFLIHFYFVRNFENCPIFSIVFNSDLKSFSKNDANLLIKDTLKQNSIIIKDEYIEDDLNVFIKTYFSDDIIYNPEDNYICPLTFLKLLNKRKDIFIKKSPKFNELSYLIVYFNLLNIYQGKAFNIEDSFSEKDSPIKIFNLEKNAYLQYLDDAKKNGLITINKTAGLNTVYFEQKLNLDKLFKKYFEVK